MRFIIAQLAFDQVPQFTGLAEREIHFRTILGTDVMQVDLASITILQEVCLLR